MTLEDLSLNQLIARADRVLTDMPDEDTKLEAALDLRCLVKAEDTDAQQAEAIRFWLQMYWR